ncbi:MAG TPA: di-trans,poly-cis-decaprenylcistransferase [Bryobacteraceae bacterium]|nr:di-trans,poly-cis-decaprenylcistransferase [Bryobacteraceae bacterium]
MRSTFDTMDNPAGDGLHVAIIMDGNGRWANSRGLPRIAGHRAGADSVRRTVEAAPSLGISVLTLYAFSADNWRRPAREVSGLMKLFARYLVQERDRCIANGVRLQAIGRRDRLPASVVELLEETEQKTAGGRKLHLRLAIDYSSRRAILDAARSLKMVTEESLSRLIGPDVDLLIRTSGEQRLSDFLLWECAYAEMIFTQRMWPEFSVEDLNRAIEEFRRRDRRFGAVGPMNEARTA